MTVLNVRVQPDRIDLLTDTMEYIGGTPYGLCETKAHVSYNGQIAWAGRGLRWISDRFTALATICMHADDADLAATVWADWITDEDLRDTKGAEIVIAGWSPHQGGLIARRYIREAGKGTEVETLSLGVHLAPRPKRLPPLPVAISDDQFTRLAHAQWKVRAQFDGTLCIGGVQHLTTVTAAGASTRIVGLYADYAEHAAELGCPIADEVAEFLALQAAA